MHKTKNCSTYSAVIKLVTRHHEPHVLLCFRGFPGWLAWFSLQIFCLNDKIHFSLAYDNNCASFKRKMFWEWRFLLNINHNQPINKLVNAAVQCPTTAIRQNDINLWILDWTLIILNWKWSESKRQIIFFFTELEID